jgi:hypothetical protein
MAAMSLPPNHPLVKTATALARLPASQHPITNPAQLQKLSPSAQARVNAVANHPVLRAVALGQTTAASVTDPTGSTQAQTNDGGNLGYGMGYGHQRIPNVRHVLLGVAALALTAAQANAKFTATPQVDFKPGKFVAMPGFNGSVANVQSGVRPQYVSTAGEDADMYQPLSYGSELDLDAVKAAVSIQGQVTNGNATATQTFYGAFIGEAVGKSYRPLSSKLQTGSLGSSGSVSANGTGTLSLTPQLDYTVRKLILTPGATFSDAFIITSISAGVLPQLMSGDPIPASVFTDLYPLFVDFDKVSAATSLSINYQNVSGSAAVLKGSTRGDCDPTQLASYGAMASVNA